MVCHYCSVSPWADLISPGAAGSLGLQPGPEKIINLEDDFIVSSRFRIKLGGGSLRQCMHLRAFELFGTILPRSNPDPTPPSPEEEAVIYTWSRGF